MEKKFEFATLKKEMYESQYNGRFFSKGKRFLLGKKDNVKYYLIEGSWDCKWYWGFGYVQTRNSHQHFDGLFFNKQKNGYDNFIEFFDEIPLTEKELWTLLELMRTFYTLREYSDTIHRGGSHYTTNPCCELIKNEDEYKRINEVVIPAVMNEVYKLLSPKKDED